MGELEVAVGLVENVLKAPEDHLVRPDDKVYTRFSRATKLFFECASHGPAKFPLPQLLVEGFDSEQIWQQIQLNNTPVMDYLESGLNNAEQAPPTALANAQSNQINEDLSDELEADEGDEGDEGDIEDALLEEPTRDGTQRTGTSRAGGTREDQKPAMHEGVKRAQGGDKQTKQTKKLASKKQGGDRDPALGGNILTFDSESEDEGDDEEDEIPAERQLDEDFADEGDEPAATTDADDNPFFSMEEMNKFADEGMEDEDNNEGNEGDEGDEEEDKPLKYNDFFDKPPPAAASALADDKSLSAFAKSNLEMKRHISALEDELIAPKPWVLTGEVAGTKRPAESLLQEDLDFDYATRPTEGLTEESSAKLEDVIKQRIIDQLFDDPERKQPPKKKAFKPLEEVSSAKSEVGLAEVYEREFLDLAKSEGEPTAAQAKLDTTHQEIATLFGQLCHKLDSLSNFTFTPKPPTEEVTVVSHAPAIAMEETIPMGVSSATLIAPEEEFKSKSTGKPTGATELEQAEKKALHHRKKRLFKKREARRVTAKGEAREAKKQQEVEDVLKQRHVKKGVVSDTTKYGASKDVFAKVSATQAAENPFARNVKAKVGSEAEKGLAGAVVSGQAASFKL